MKTKRELLKILSDNLSQEQYQIINELGYCIRTYYRDFDSYASYYLDERFLSAKEVKELYNTFCNKGIEQNETK